MLTKLLPIHPIDLFFKRLSTQRPPLVSPFLHQPGNFQQELGIAVRSPPLRLQLLHQENMQSIIGD